MEPPEDRDGYVRWFHAQFERGNIRATLALAGAHLIAYELIKARIVDDVRAFHMTGLKDDEAPSPRYRDEVLGRHPSVYRASVAWLVDAEALTPEQATVLEELHEARKLYAHETTRVFIDPHVEVRPNLLVDARAILAALSRFWARINMAALPEWDGVEVSDEDISSGDLLVLDEILMAIAELDAEGDED